MTRGLITILNYTTLKQWHPQNWHRSSLITILNYTTLKPIGVVTKQ